MIPGHDALSLQREQEAQLPSPRREFDFAAVTDDSNAVCIDLLGHPDVARSSCPQDLAIDLVEADRMRALRIGIGTLVKGSATRDRVPAKDPIPACWPPSDEPLGQRILMAGSAMLSKHTPRRGLPYRALGLVKFFGGAGQVPFARLKEKAMPPVA